MLDYTGGPYIIMRVLIRGGRRVRESDVRTEAEVTERQKEREI